MHENLNRFAGKTVIVTGSGSGIGEATARRFSEEGANVVLNGRTREKLDKVAEDLPAERTLVIDGDVGEPSDVDRLVSQALDRFGAIDCLVNNAGVATAGPIEKVDAEGFERVMRTNVEGVYRCTKAAWDALKRAKGSVVNVSSVSGLGGDWSFFAYNASKGAVSNMTRALALDLKDSGVRVNAVCPSLTETEMTSGMKGNEALLSAFAERLPMGRPADPAEVAAVIAFLASEDAVFVNGVNLPVDGGLSASNGQPQLR